MRFPLTLLAYLKLIQLDFYLARRDFAAIHDMVRDYTTEKPAPRPDTLDRVCSAVDMACIWYCKDVLCLQRSAATVWLLNVTGLLLNW